MEFSNSRIKCNVMYETTSRGICTSLQGGGWAHAPAGFFFSLSWVPAAFSHLQKNIWISARIKRPNYSCFETQVTQLSCCITLSAFHYMLYSSITDKWVHMLYRTNLSVTRFSHTLVKHNTSAKYRRSSAKRTDSRSEVSYRWIELVHHFTGARAQTIPLSKTT